MSSRTPSQLQLNNRGWRLCNLYWITDENGRKVPFRPNPVQKQLYSSLHTLNVVLKSRQHGMTTFIDLMILDSCLFVPNITAGIIAHHVDDAKRIFRNKIKFAYENLPESLREMIPADTSKADEIVFANKSSITVSTSFRSGTAQMLHVSELGKIAAKYPDKAREIKTGAFEAVHPGNVIFVESTAEGRGGLFYDLVQMSQKHAELGRELGPMDWKLHFFAWFEDPRHVLNPRFIVMTAEEEEYFASLEARGIKLTPEQKAWYAAKSRVLNDDMKREHPSTPDEAFEQVRDGAYYKRELEKIRKTKRITEVPYNEYIPVNTFWDLGLNDEMAIWFHQRIGTQNKIIDYYENSGEGLPHYARVLRDKGYGYGVHYMPHDANVRDLGTGERREDKARSLGIRPIVVVARAKNNEEVMNGIEEVREFLGSCVFDEKRCAKGLAHLENYQRKWDERNARWMDTPLHNSASNCADALRTGAVGYEPATPYQTQHLNPEVYHDS